MSDTGKDTVAPKEKDGAEKRGRGRPRKHPQVTTDVLHLGFYEYYWARLPASAQRVGFNDAYVRTWTEGGCYCSGGVW